MGFEIVEQNAAKLPELLRYTNISDIVGCGTEWVEKISSNQLGDLYSNKCLFPRTNWYL
jgi:hypothetical protein